MGTLASIDGRLVPPGAARLSIFDRGFLYGDSIYEVFRTYRGHLFEAEAHLDRLERSGELIGLVLPVPRGLLLARIERTLAASGNDESYVRLVITRGEGEIGLDPALARNPHVVVIVRPLAPPPPDVYRDGVEACVVHVRRNLREAVDPAAKTGNYLNSVLAVREARARGAHEALMLDANGRVTEGSSSNVFAVRAGGLATPPLDGILEGVTRRVVLDLAGQLGLPAAETPLGPEDLFAADELFLTSTTREIVPLVRLDGRAIGSGRPGPVTRRLLAAFRARAGVAPVDS